MVHEKNETQFTFVFFPFFPFLSGMHERRVVRVRESVLDPLIACRCKIRAIAVFKSEIVANTCCCRTNGHLGEGCSSLAGGKGGRDTDAPFPLLPPNNSRWTDSMANYGTIHQM